MTTEQLDYGSRMFGALANPARIHILEFLSNGPAPVTRIAEAVGLKQSMTSQHLAVLLAAGIVVFSASGNQRIYRLRGPRVTRILELVEEFHQAHLSNLRELLAANPRKESMQGRAS